MASRAVWGLARNGGERRAAPGRNRSRAREQPPSVRAMQWALVFGFGGLGAVIRVAIGAAIGARAFPWATLLVNFAGCLAIGVLHEWLTARAGLSPLWRPALVGGLLGGFTTFSAFGLETWQLLQSERALAALLYALASLGLGVAAVAAGISLARHAA